MPARVLAVSLLAVVSSTAAGQGRLYWANLGEGKLQRANALDGSDVEDVAAEGVDRPWGVAVHEASCSLFWSDLGSSSIRRAHLDGSGAAPFVRFGTGEAATGLFVDGVGGRLYWVQQDSRVGRAGLLGDGSDAEELQPRSFVGRHSVVVAAARSEIFWADKERWRIQRAGLGAGAGASDLVSEFQDIGLPQRLALDARQRHLYWTDSEHKQIRRVDLETSAVEVVIGSLSYPMGIAAQTTETLGTAMYWSDQGSATVQQAFLAEGAGGVGVTFGWSLKLGEAARLTDLAVMNSSLTMAASCFTSTTTTSSRTTTTDMWTAATTASITDTSTGTTTETRTRTTTDTSTRTTTDTSTITTTDTSTRTTTDTSTRTTTDTSTRTRTDTGARTTTDTSTRTTTTSVIATRSTSTSSDSTSGVSTTTSIPSTTTSTSSSKLALATSTTISASAAATARTTTVSTSLASVSSTAAGIVVTHSATGVRRTVAATSSSAATSIPATRGVSTSIVVGSRPSTSLMSTETATAMLGSRTTPSTTSGSVADVGFVGHVLLRITSTPEDMRAMQQDAEAVRAALARGIAASLGVGADVVTILGSRWAVAGRRLATSAWSVVVDFMLKAPAGLWADAPPSLHESLLQAALSAALPSTGAAVSVDVLESSLASAPLTTVSPESPPQEIQVVELATASDQTGASAAVLAIITSVIGGLLAVACAVVLCLKQVHARRELRRTKPQRGTVAPMISPRLSSSVQPRPLEERSSLQALAGDSSPKRIGVLTEVVDPASPSFESSPRSLMSPASSAHGTPVGTPCCFPIRPLALPQALAGATCTWRDAAQAKASESHSQQQLRMRFALAGCCIAAGDLSAALEALHAAWHLAGDVDVGMGMDEAAALANAVCALGCAPEAILGDPRAAAVYEEALAVCQLVGDRVMVLCNLGDARFSLGDSRGALQAFLDGRGLLAEAAELKQGGTAIRLLRGLGGAALRLAEDHGADRSRHLALARDAFEEALQLLGIGGCGASSPRGRGTRPSSPCQSPHWRGDAAPHYAARLLSALGRAERLAGDVGDGLRHLSEAARLADAGGVELHSVWAELAECRRATGDDRGAIDALRRARRGLGGTRQGLGALVGLGAAQAAAGEHEAALDSLGAALAACGRDAPEGIGLLLEIGASRSALGDIEGALAAYREAVDGMVRARAACSAHGALLLARLGAALGAHHDPRGALSAAFDGVVWGEVFPGIGAAEVDAAARRRPGALADPELVFCRLASRLAEARPERCDVVASVFAAFGSAALARGAARAAAEAYALSVDAGAGRSPAEALALAVAGGARAAPPTTLLAARRLAALGAARLACGEGGGALAAFRRARQLHEAMGTLACEDGLALLLRTSEALGDAALALATLEEARELCEGALRLTTPIGVGVMTRLGHARIASEDFLGASIAFREACGILALLGELGTEEGALLLMSTGDATRAAGHLAQAAKDYEDALSALRTLGNDSPTARLRAHIARRRREMAADEGAGGAGAAKVAAQLLSL